MQINLREGRGVGFVSDQKIQLTINIKSVNENVSIRYWIWSLAFDTRFRNSSAVWLIVPSKKSWYRSWIGAGRARQRRPHVFSLSSGSNPSRRQMSGHTPSALQAMQWTWTRLCFSQFTSIILTGEPLSRIPVSNLSTRPKTSQSYHHHDEPLSMGNIATQSVTMQVLQQRQ